jgi:hypothetical protein
MNRIEALRLRVNRIGRTDLTSLQAAEVRAVRRQIIEVMLDCLAEHKDTLDDWKKTHFSNAIGALGLNIHAVQQPTISWLRLCLADFGKAILPLMQRDRNFRTTDASMRDVTWEQLAGALESLGRELG